MTYYIENRKSSEENEKRSFGRATLLRKKRNTENWKVKGQKDADETVHKRATRKNYSDSKIFFCRTEIVKIFTTFCVY